MTTLSLIQLKENDVPGAKFTGREVEDHSNLQLKRWLTCRALKSTGNRSELIERCKLAIQCGKKDVIDITVDSGKWYDKKQAEQAPSSSGQSSIVPIFGWKSFSSSFLAPLFNYGNVFHWIVESLPSLPTCTGDSDDNDDNSSVTTEKPLRRGRLYVTSGNVGEVRVKLDANKFFYKAQVLPSMWVDNYMVTVTISGMSGTVIDASCHCKASALRRCSDIAALLLFLSDHVGASGKTPACTDLPWQWNRGQKRRNPTSIRKAHYPSKKPPKKIVIEFDPRQSGSGVDSQTINCFLSDLQTGEKPCMWETVLQYSYEDYNLDKEQMNLLLTKIRILNKDLSEDVCSKCSHPIMVENTIDQVMPAAWEQYRYLRLTASTAKEAVQLWKAINSCGPTNGIEHRVASFLRKKLWGLDKVQTFSMKHGLDNEDLARSDYFTHKQATVPNITVGKSGFWINPKFSELGCSPDGLVTDPSSSDQQGVLEIKILKIFTDYSPKDITAKVAKGEMKEVISRQCFKVTGDSILLKTSHQYYYRVQFQLGITECQWCDFILWSPKGISVQRIERDQDFIEDMFSANMNLWESVLAPEIFEMKTPRNLKPLFCM